jgi:hypothetical protein
MSYYSECKQIKCHKCGTLIEPFYFGDKPLDRRVGIHCPSCATDNTFYPKDVDSGPNTEFILGKQSWEY